MRKIVPVLALAALCFVVASAQDADPTVAKINYTKPQLIKLKELRQYVVLAAGGEDKASAVSYEEARKALEGLANQKLLLQAAEKDGVKVTDAELQKQVDQLRQSAEVQARQKLADVQFWDLIKRQTGMSKDRFMDEQKKALVLQKFVATKKKALFDSLKAPTNDEIQQAYELNKAALVRPETVRLSVISFDVAGKSDADKQDILAKAKAMNADIKKSPGKWDDYFQKGKDGSGDGYKAGDAGYFPKTQQVMAAIGDKVFKVVFALRLGDVSEPVDTPLGIQLYKVTEQYTFKSPLELTDPVTPGATVNVGQYIANQLANQKLQVTFAQAYNDLIAELKTKDNYILYDFKDKWNK
jgi:hypothetical protein